MSDLEVTSIPISELELSDIEQRANRVISLVKKSAEIWLQVATEVNDAKLKLSPIAFKQFLDRATLTPAIADKMPRIAQQMILYSENAQRHLSKLEGWTTLYEVAKLPPKKVAELISTLDEQPDIVVTRAFIQQFKTSTSSNSAPPVRVAEIMISEDLLMRLDFDQFLKFRESLDDIQRIVDRSYPAASINLKTKILNELEAKLLNPPEAETEETIFTLNEHSPLTIEATAN